MENTRSADIDRICEALERVSGSIGALVQILEKAKIPSNPTETNPSGIYSETEPFENEVYNSNEGFYTDPEQEVEHADLEGPELSHYAVPPSPSPPPSAPSLDPPYTRLCLMNVCRDSPTFSAPDKLVTSSSNNKCNESRPYLKCSNPGCRAFIGWLDQRGIHENNPHCLCGIPSRKLVKVKSRREPELFRIWFNCANSNLDCGFREDAPKVEGSSRIDFIDLILNHDDICRMKTDGEI